MKKILFAIAIVMTMSLAASAQGRDGFFSNWDYATGDRTTDPTDPTFTLPSSHGVDTNTEAPLGSGLLVLTALGAGYAVCRKKRSL